MGTLAQIFLSSSDLDTSRTFYEDGLGLSPKKVGNSNVAYETGGCELMLEQDFEPEELDVFNLSPPPSDGRGAGAVFVIEVEDQLEAIYDRMDQILEPDSGTLLIEPREVPWGGYMFLASDPDGYVVEVRAVDE